MLWEIFRRLSISCTTSSTSGPHDTSQVFSTRWFLWPGAAETSVPDSLSSLGGSIIKMKHTGWTETREPVNIMGINLSSQQPLVWAGFPRPLNYHCGAGISWNKVFVFVCYHFLVKLIKELIDCFVVLLINSIWCPFPWR